MVSSEYNGNGTPFKNRLDGRCCGGTEFLIFVRRSDDISAVDYFYLTTGEDVSAEVKVIMVQITGKAQRLLTDSIGCK